MSSPPSPTDGRAHGAPWRRWLPRALTEGVLIAASVVAGLAATDWHDRRERRDRAAQALRAIAAELDSNAVRVRRARLHHRAMADTLQRYLDAGRALPERVYFGGVYSPAYVLDVAWASARDAGVTAQLPYPLVLRLASVYERQAQYRTLGDGITRTVYGDLMTRGTLATFRDNAASWRVLVEDFANREGRLEEQYVALRGAVRHASRR